MSLHVLPVPPSRLGESPFWHPDEQTLYWCDIQGQKVWAWRPDGGPLRQWDLPSEPGCCAPTDQGNLVIGLRDGFYRLDPRHGQLTCLALLDHDTRDLRLNDGRCDSHGRFWAGSVYAPKTAPLASLWCLRATPTGYAVQRMAGDNLTANGLAFSPDDRWMYWANTPAHRIDRFEWNAATGTLGARTPWRQFEPRTEGQPYGGRPDGAAVDAEGHYWVAMYEGACILRLRPDGSVAQQIDTPVLYPTMVCFGGPDLRTLYVTSAVGNAQAPLPGTQVAPGSLLQMRVDVPGLPVQRFREAA